MRFSHSRLRCRAQPDANIGSPSPCLLFCLLDNDAEVIFPLFLRDPYLEADAFDERVAGELLGGIFRQVVRDHEKRSVTAEERDRLALLTKTATASNSGRASPTPAEEQGRSPSESGQTVL